MERSEPERNELTYAERIWLKEWKRKSWTSTRSKRAKERPSEVEVPPLEWRRVCEIRQWGEDCRARIFYLFREYNLQRQQSKQEELTEEEEMKQQQRMVIMHDLRKKIKSKGRIQQPLVCLGVACEGL